LEDLIEDALGNLELLSEEALLQRLALPQEQLPQALLSLKGLEQTGKALAFSLDGKRLWVGGAALDWLRRGIVELLTPFHKAHPARAGISRELIREKLGKGIEPRGFGILLEALESGGTVRLKGEFVASRGFRPRFRTSLPRRARLRSSGF